jgi:hypothetical protein
MNLVVDAEGQEVVLWAAPARSAVLDIAVEGASVTLRTVGGAVRVARTVARPLVAVVLRPPLVEPPLQPVTWLRGLARRGALHRLHAQSEVERLLDRLVPLVVLAVLDRVDLNRVVREKVDLDGLVAGVDVDAVAQRLDLDAVLDRVDLNKVVRERVDVDGLVATVDVAAVVDRLDLRALAEQVIAEVDLPEIIRASTGSVTSDTVRGARMRSISGDEAVARAADRFRLRRRPAVPPPATEPP